MENQAEATLNEQNQKEWDHLNQPGAVLAYAQPKNPFPFESSDQIDKILPAFIAAQASIGRARMDSTGRIGKEGARSYQYADLASCMDAVQEPLTQNSLGVSFAVSPASGKGNIRVKTVLVHASGQWFATPVEIDLGTQPSPQDVGKALTYAKRYGLCAITGLAPGADDDDGASAQNAWERSRQQQERQSDRQQEQRAKSPHEAGIKHSSATCETCKALEVKPGYDVVQRNPGDHLYVYQPGGPVIPHDLDNGSADYCPVCQEEAKKRPTKAQDAPPAQAPPAAPTSPTPAQNPGPPPQTEGARVMTSVERIAAITKAADVTQAQAIAFICNVCSSNTVKDADRRFLAATLDALERFLSNDGQKATYVLLTANDKDSNHRYAAVWKECLAKYPAGAAPAPLPAQEPAQQVLIDESDDEDPPAPTPAANDGIEGRHILSARVTRFKSENTSDGPSIVVQCSVLGPESVKEKLSGFPMRVSLATEHFKFGRFFLVKFGHPSELLDLTPPKVQKKSIVGAEGKMLVQITKHVSGEGYVVNPEAFDRPGGTELEERLAKKTA